MPEESDDPKRFLDALKRWGFADKSEVDNEDLHTYFNTVKEDEVVFAPSYEQVRVTCFTSEPNNLLLWSHYADGLRGYCALFDPEIITEGPEKCVLVSVNYVDQPPKLDSFLYTISTDKLDYYLMAADEAESSIRAGIESERDWLCTYQDEAHIAYNEIVEAWREAFASKPLEWKYENEQRLLIFSEGNGTEPIFYRYPSSALKEIIIGEKMPDRSREDLCDIIFDMYDDVIIRTAVRSQNAYAIEIA